MRQHCHQCLAHGRSPHVLQRSRGRRVEVLGMSLDVDVPVILRRVHQCHSHVTDATPTSAIPVARQQSQRGHQARLDNLRARYEAASTASAECNRPPGSAPPTYYTASQENAAVADPRQTFRASARELPRDQEHTGPRLQDRWGRGASSLREEVLLERRRKLPRGGSNQPCVERRRHEPRRASRGLDLIYWTLAGTRNQPTLR